MLTMQPGTRNEPTQFICSECGNPVRFTLHHDFMEANCCSIEYQTRMNDGVWNCCSVGHNSPGGRGEQIAEETEKFINGEISNMTL